METERRIQKFQRTETHETTNCIVAPRTAGYIDRLYTTGPAAYPGCRHITADKNGHKDFSELIEHARRCEPPEEIEHGEITAGFAHDQVIALADKIVDAVKSGAIKKFVVMAGRDGRFPSRDYYTEFAKSLPGDTVILTAGCAKFRYNKLDLGDIGGIPRIPDAWRVQLCLLAGSDSPDAQRCLRT